MRRFKRVQVVTLPSNRESNIQQNKFNKLFFSEQEKSYSDTINQHLYIVSDYKIKEGDWIINRWKEVHQITKNDGKEYIKTCKKIIATTDESLKLPRLSIQFIQMYIEYYNECKTITDILVEYEIRSNVGLGHNEWIYLKHIEGKRYVPIKIEANNQDIYQLGKEDTFEDHELECKLKVSPTDNTITIKKVKDSYTREEVDRMLDEQVSITTAEMMKKFKGYKSKDEIKRLLFKFTNHFDLKRNIEITSEMQSEWLDNQFKN